MGSSRHSKTKILQDENSTTGSEENDHKNDDMKIIANTLDKIFGIAMAGLTLTTTVVIVAPILKSTHSESIAYM